MLVYVGMLDSASMTPLAALGLLAALRGRKAKDAAHGLANLIGSSRTLLPVAEVLSRWASRDRVLGRP